jgi:hypothetical protein
LKRQGQLGKHTRCIGELAYSFKAFQGVLESQEGSDDQTRSVGCSGNRVGLSLSRASGEVGLVDMLSAKVGYASKFVLKLLDNRAIDLRFLTEQDSGPKAL